MIRYVTGDLLLSDAQAIAHGVAPFDHFDNGLALSLREHSPAMFKDFKHWCHGRNPEPGQAWTWAGVGGKRIICLLTQEAPAQHGHGHPGRASLTHVNHALRELHKVIESEKLTSVALPRLATGVGGLEWSAVKPLIEQHLGALKIPVLVYEHFEKGRKADEKLPVLADI
jgi:O-acetyl-ADP-ribose deacetylase (regulator of RNase III)